MAVNELKVIALCTLSTGFDAIAEFVRQGGQIVGIVGLDPEYVDLDAASGWVDVSIFAKKWGIPHYYVSDYGLHDSADRHMLEVLNCDLLWVAGWQRLIPKWAMESARLGAIGGHGSPDGITGGRGRSPQNWAIILGCDRFDISLFRIQVGVDDGAVIAQRSFFYNVTDDIAVSYKKSSLCMASMMLEVFRSPVLLENAAVQEATPFYYPQRKPEHGSIDWFMTQREIWAYCRALTRPYPGARTRCDDKEIYIWKCLPFDEVVQSQPGTLDTVFEDGSFLVSCGNGRLLVEEYSCDEGWEPCEKSQFDNTPMSDTFEEIVSSHHRKYPEQPVARRILNQIPAKS
ncbi:MAG: formyltransferase family protein [Halioglobus sp.]